MREQVSTLPEFLRAPRERIPMMCLLLLLTLNAGWTDTLCYLFLSHVFSSFMTGNFLFIGLSLAQGDSGLLVRAIVAVLVYLIGAIFGSFYLTRTQQQPTESIWLTSFARYLLLEWIVLLIFAIWWQFTGNLTSHHGTQIALLALAAFAMGTQGALVTAFNIPGVVANALTGTVLLLGRRLVQHGNRHVTEKQYGWERSAWFLVILCLFYILSAIIAVLIMPYIAIQFIPVIIVTIAIFVLLVSSIRNTAIASGDIMTPVP
jgi:uncharacterized membrane protein YoaK (UPF0700 family)